MKTRMKKLISIKSIPVLALALLLVLGTVLADDAAIQAKKPAPSLRCTTEYDFVGAQGIVVEGRLLCWEGPISGDIEGVIKWWLVLPKSPPTGQVGHMLFRWEIWDIDPVLCPDDAVLLLAGDENERTIVRHGKNSVWLANGIVTEASEEFEDWIGRPMHDGGHFTWTIPGLLPDHGEGTFRIN